MSYLVTLAGAFTQLDLNRPKLVGVYLLVSGDDVVYVGQSLDIETRIAQHVGDKLKEFDRAMWLQLAPEDLNRYEGALIRALHPVYNDTAPASRGGDIAVLEALGLPTSLLDEPPRKPSRSSATSASVGRRILFWRSRAGMTQRDLAKKIGVTAAAVAQWELGQTEPRHARIEAIAGLLGVSVSEFWESA